MPELCFELLNNFEKSMCKFYPFLEFTPSAAPNTKRDTLQLNSPNFEWELTSRRTRVLHKEFQTCSGRVLTALLTCYHLARYVTTTSQKFWKLNRIIPAIVGHLTKGLSKTDATH
ncbi:hypothetical protein NPIL_510111 [Nephila pilipes]|uniref:Uncharacterized protein n=1 Tax=Nephila pilipes TaxID=299642 RepID=A0A8X6PPE8_NEPPI|nr:hypothetical protein NPIL_510111 [Nephila pilipes]